MPTDLDNFSLYVVVEGSGSLNFHGSAATVRGVNYAAAFSYSVGRLPATAFETSWKKDGVPVSGDEAPTTIVEPSTPSTDIGVQTGTVTGVLPPLANGVDSTEYELSLTLVIPDS